MKILSWNIWIDCHFDEVKKFLAAADADIIGLQEVKDDDPERDVIGFLAGLGYGHVFAKTEQNWKGKIYRHGPAVFSKYPIVSSESFFIDPVDQRAAARADIDVGGQVLHVFSTHTMHTHQQPSEKQEAQIARLLDKAPREHTIVMGDFNATPDSAAIRMMRERLVDTDPTDKPTWSVYPEGCGTCLPQGIDTRLDYIFVSKDIAFHSHEVGESKGSDHLPVMIRLD
jgi:endonuclease/exonuclease/phosphatase family metal-dependent hydrolase